MKTLLKYPGSKWRIANWIISHFPKHKVYIEPFFGSGAIFFNKKHAYIETINDIDGDVVNLFRVCRERPTELARLIEMTPFARDEFCDCYEKSDDPIEQARRTIVRYHQSFGTSNRSKNSWKNTQTARGPRCATMWNYLPSAIVECAQQLKAAQIENIDAIELIRRYNDKDTLIYCDPPYLQSLRQKNIYACEMDDTKHIELLDVLKNSNSMVVISGYDNEFYNRELKDWSTNAIKTIAQFGLHRVEKIWANFEFDSQLKFDLNRKDGDNSCL